MSEHRIELKWAKTTPDFQYETYDRTHQVRFSGGIECRASSAPEYLGNKDLTNPEELLVAAVSSCHMLTFLAVAAKSKLTLETYEDQAVGYLEKDDSGKVWVKKIVLKPKTKFSGANPPDPEKLKSLHDKAHHNCFIANSIKTEVTYEL